MYNETYDDYIRSILGYPSRNLYEQNNEQLEYPEYRNPTFNTNINIFGNNIELENSYPEIYKIVYPMVTTKCNNVRAENITEKDIENMTDEIYYALESRNETQVNINLTNDMSTVKTANTTTSINKKPVVKVSETEHTNRETRQIDRGLRDLIKILLIRELLNRRRLPFRPPMPNPPGPGPRPPRPQFGY